MHIQKLDATRCFFSLNILLDQKLPVGPLKTQKLIVDQTKETENFERTKVGCGHNALKQNLMLAQMQKKKVVSKPNDHDQKNRINKTKTKSYMRSKSI